MRVDVSVPVTEEVFRSLDGDRILDLVLEHARKSEQCKPVDVNDPETVRIFIEVVRY